jgi:Zn-dependent protease with chaperone function
MNEAPAAMTPTTATNKGVSGKVYDGLSIAGKPALLRIEGHQCWVEAQTYTWTGHVDTVNWGEPNQQGTRIVTLTNEAQFAPTNSNELTQYLTQQGLNKQWVARLALHWHWVFAALLGIATACVALYVWGMPFASKVLAAYVPQTVQASLGKQTLDWLEESNTFTPSTLAAQQQAAILQQWQAVLAKAYPDANTQPAMHQVLFRQMKGIPNAMALLGGTIVLTDDLVKLLQDQPDALMGVLAHELGHVNHHHSMQLLISVTGLGLLQTVLLGDATGIFAQVPLALGFAGYSRKHESQADDEAIRIMLAAGLSPAKMALFFERVRAYKVNPKQGTANLPDPSQDKNELEEAAQKYLKQLPDMFDSHPADDARI